MTIKYPYHGRVVTECNTRLLQTVRIGPFYNTCCIRRGWGLFFLSVLLTLCMLGNFFKYLFLSKFSKNSLFPPIFLLIYNLNVKQFGSQMKPHILWGFIWIQIVCKGHQRSSKFTASRLRVKINSYSKCIPNNKHLAKVNIEI